MIQTNPPIDVAIDSLLEHPRQGDFFSATSPAELQELADDLQHRGQQEPIHLCADGKTLVCGHRRTTAAKRLGWKTLRAVVHRDWTDPNAREVIEDLVSDNLLRRQLDDLGLARCYQFWNENLVLDAAEKGRDRRDVLAARMNCGKSGRTLERLEKLLELPRDIQDMITSKTVTKDQGGRILKLSAEKREGLYAALRSGEDVKKVLLRFGVTEPKRSKTAADLGAELVRFLKKNVDYLEDTIEELDRVQVRDCDDVVGLLDRAANLLADWSDRKQRLHDIAIAEMRANLPQKPTRMSRIGSCDFGQFDQNCETVLDYQNASLSSDERSEL